MLSSSSSRNSTQNNESRPTLNHTLQYKLHWLAVDKVIAEISRLSFFGPPCIHACMSTLYLPVTINALQLGWTGEGPLPLPYIWDVCHSVVMQAVRSHMRGPRCKLVSICKLTSIQKFFKGNKIWHGKWTCPGVGGKMGGHIDLFLQHNSDNNSNSHLLGKCWTNALTWKKLKDHHIFC